MIRYRQYGSSVVAVRVRFLFWKQIECVNDGGRGRWRQMHSNREARVVN